MNVTNAVLTSRFISEQILTEYRILLREIRLFVIILLAGLRPLQMIDGFIDDEQITGEFTLSCTRDTHSRWMDASGPHRDEDVTLKEAADRTGNMIV